MSIGIRELGTAAGLGAAAFAWIGDDDTRAAEFGRWVEAQAGEPLSDTHEGVLAIVEDAMIGCTMLHTMIREDGKNAGS